VTFVLVYVFTGFKKGSQIGELRFYKKETAEAVAKFLNVQGVQTIICEDFK
jgi:hypothetical protein